MRRSGNILDNGFVLAFIVSPILLILAMPAIASDWQQFQKDEVNSGWTNDSAPITNASGTDESWVHQTVSGNFYGIDTVPVVHGDYVYVLASNANNVYLYKYYKNGTAAGGSWPITVGSGNLQNSCPASGDGKVFVINTGYGSSNTPRLYGIDASTGNEEINVSVGTSDYQVSCPITYYEAGSIKRLFFGSVRMSNQDPVNLSDDGIYYCYYANNGTQAWSRNTNSGGGYYWAGAAVIGNYLVYGDDESNVTSVYLNNGTTVDEQNVSTLWNDFDAKEIRSSIVYNASTDRIYFSSKAGYCYAIGIYDNGTFNTSDKWKRNIGYSTSTPAVYNGRVYVGHSQGFSNGKVHCLYETNGTQKWETSSIGPVQSSPAISTWYDNGTNSATGGLYCIDKDGSEVWHNNSVGTQSSHRYCLGGAAISGGWVFYGNDGGYLHGLANWTRYDFDVRAGTDKWAFKYQVDNSPGPGDPGEEFNATEYANIRFDDDVYASNKTSTDDYYAAHRFNFSIDDNEEDFITTINVTWKGIGKHDSLTDGAKLYIYNFTSTAYEHLQTSANVETEVTLTNETTSSASNYINAGNVTVLVNQTSAQEVVGGRTKYSHIETDYVKLVVTP
jgi:outer membrane protein assembly factor BamB